MKLQIQKTIEKPIIGKDGKPTKKTETFTETKVVHRVDYLQTGSWQDQGWEVIAEAGMDFKKQKYGGGDE